MGQKIRGGMWCDSCNRPVMAVKNTHAIRNSLSLPFGAVTSAFSLSGMKPLGMKIEKFVCPHCGGKTRKR